MSDVEMKHQTYARSISVRNMMKIHRNDQGCHRQLLQM